MPGFAHSLDVRRVRALAGVRLGRIGAGGRPVVVGPWLGEVGIELLFWIPFVRKVLADRGVAPERVWAVSRGGVSSWYSGVAGNYVELFDRVEPAALRAWADARVERTGGQKQWEVGDDDRAALEAVAGGLPDGHDLLHPSLMFGALADFWDWRDARAPLARALEALRFEPIPAPPRPEGVPDRYVAVKAYFNPLVPDTPGNRDFLTALVSTLAERTDVVMLATGLDLDDHPDFAPGAAERVHSIEHQMDPPSNLALQTAVLAHADASYGVQGGLGYLAALLGTDSICFYDRDEFNPTHRELFYRARRDLAERGHDAAFASLSVAGARLLL